MANKAYKFRIYPTEEQKLLSAKTFGCVRLVYNYYLEQKIKLYQKEKKEFLLYKMFQRYDSTEKNRRLSVFVRCGQYCLTVVAPPSRRCLSEFFQPSGKRISEIQIQTKKPEILYNCICKRQYFFGKWIFETAESRACQSQTAQTNP